MKTNVALFIKGLPYGGAERVVQRLSYILKPYYNLYVIVFDDAITEYPCGCEMINMGLPSNRSMLKKLTAVVQRTRSLNRIVREYKLDVVISFLDGANLVNLLSNQKHRRIISIRNYKGSERKLSMAARVADAFISRLYSRADQIVPVSQLIAQSLERDYKVDPHKLQVIYNPYDMEEITQLAAAELEPEHEQFYHQAKVIVAVGRKAHQKGMWHLLKAFHLVRQQVPQAKLVIVGDGEQDGRIRQLADDLGIREALLLPGHQDNPFKFIRRSEAFVMSSLFEGFPNALVEAMACGKPVISTDCKSGPREILCQHADLGQVATDIEHADYGILVPPFTEQENWNAAEHEPCEQMMAQAIVQVLTQPALLQRYSERAAERAQTFNYERCREAFQEVVGVTAGEMRRQHAG